MYAELDFGIVHQVMKNNLHSIIHFHMEYQKKYANTHMNIPPEQIVFLFIYAYGITV